MAALERSGETFRRSGSSGLVWEDRFLPAEMDSNKAAAEARPKKDEPQPQQDQPGAGGYRTRVATAIDPPSPKAASGCCFGIFDKPHPSAASVSKPKPKPNPQHRPAGR